MSATDNVGGSGVAKTEYSLDDVNWNTYTGSFTITAEGTTTVYYHSTDKAGNVEDVKQQVIKIDKTPPSITATVQDSYALNSSLIIDYAATDALSGIGTVQATLNGIPVDKGTLSTLTKLGTNQLQIVATDNAGNVQILVKNFEVYLPVNLTINPNPININAQGKVTAFVVLPSAYSIPPLPNSVNLNGVLAIDENLTNPNQLVFKFSRTDLVLKTSQEILNFGNAFSFKILRIGHLHRSLKKGI